MFDKLFRDLVEVVLAFGEFGGVLFGLQRDVLLVLVVVGRVVHGPFALRGHLAPHARLERLDDLFQDDRPQVLLAGHSRHRLHTAWHGTAHQYSTVQQHTFEAKVLYYNLLRWTETRTHSL